MALKLGGLLGEVPWSQVGKALFSGSVIIAVIGLIAASVTSMWARSLEENAFREIRRRQRGGGD